MVLAMRQTAEGRVHVFTFKDGLLARAAHDLRLRVERFLVSVDEQRVTASFDADSLRVDGTMREGALDRQELSDKDKEQIERTTRDEILQASRHPKVVFEGTEQKEGDRHRVAGQLSLRGKKLPIELLVREEQGRLKGAVELEPSRWGIRPYKALLGAIKLQDRVRLELDLADLS